MFICLFASSSSTPDAFRADKLQLVVLGELGISRLQGRLLACFCTYVSSLKLPERYPK